MVCLFWIIVFCRGESGSVRERSRLLLCSSHILLICALFLSSLECRLFGELSNCRSLRPILRGHLPRTLRSWSLVVAFPKGPRLSSALYSSQPLGISP